MEFVEKIFVINLKHQTARLEEFFRQIKKMGIDETNIEVIDAIYKPHNDPCLGCNISHLFVYELAKKRKYKNILIFEDDFNFIVDAETFHEKIKQFFKKTQSESFVWDVVMLSYNNIKTKPYDELLGICLNTQSASGYLVNSLFFDKLIKIMQEGVKMQFLTGRHWVFANDQIWKSLQNSDIWFYFMERLGKQRPFLNKDGVLIEYNC